MKWRSINEHPRKYESIVLLCESNRVFFYGEYDGESFNVWNDEDGIWTKPSGETVVGWMPQKEVEEYLINLRP